MQGGYYPQRLLQLQIVGCTTCFIISSTAQWQLLQSHWIPLEFSIQRSYVHNIGAKLQWKQGRKFSFGSTKQNNLELYQVIYSIYILQYNYIQCNSQQLPLPTSLTIVRLLRVFPGCLDKGWTTAAAKGCKVSPQHLVEEVPWVKDWRQGQRRWTASSRAWHCYLDLFGSTVIVVESRMGQMSQMLQRSSKCDDVSCISSVYPCFP